MASLGQQIEAKRQQQQQGQRITRTQRVKQQQAEQKYSNQKAQADALAGNLWKDVEYVEQETYVADYRPREYSARDWSRMRQRDKDNIMRQYARNMSAYIRNGTLIAHSSATRDVTKTRPFTNDDYGNFVEGLSPELKKFFVTKEQLITQHGEWRGEQKTKVQTQMETIRKAQADYEQRIKDKIKNKEEWWHNKSRSYRDDEKNKKRYRESLNDYEDDLEEKQAYYRGQIEKLG